MTQYGQVVKVCGYGENADMEEEEEEENWYFTVKTQLRSIVRSVYRDTMIGAIAEHSNMSAKICALGSLLLVTPSQ